MADASLRILLLDDDIYERNFVERAMAISSPVPVLVTHALRIGQALEALTTQSYHLILLDNYLTRGMTVKHTIPAINNVRGNTPLAVLTSDTTPDYLSCPHDLGVDFIVDKINLVKFLQSQFDRKVAATVCDLCEFNGKSACKRNIAEKIAAAVVA